MLRWSATVWRKMEALRDRIMRGAGTQESWFLEDPQEFADETGYNPVSAQWRKPLRLDEVNQMAPTLEVIARPGRP